MPSVLGSGSTTIEDCTRDYTNWQLSTHVEGMTTLQSAAGISLIQRVYSFWVAMNTANNWKAVLWADLSLFGSRTRNWWYSVEDFHQIIDGLYLGEQPSHDKSHLEKITQLGINSIVAILSEDETKDSGIIVVKENEFANKNITYKRFSTPDDTASTLEIMNQAVDYIKDQRGNNKTVLVHCRKGIGRSASIVLAYMVKHAGWEPEAAINHATTTRNIINLNPHQKQRFMEFANEVKNTGTLTSLADSVTA